jgi:hypothetical protein
VCVFLQGNKQICTNASSQQQPYNRSKFGVRSHHKLCTSTTENTYGDLFAKIITNDSNKKVTISTLIFHLMKSLDAYLFATTITPNFSKNRQLNKNK